MWAKNKFCNAKKCTPIVTPKYPSIKPTRLSVSIPTHHSDSGSEQSTMTSSERELQRLVCVEALERERWSAAGACTKRSSRITQRPRGHDGADYRQQQRTTDRRHALFITNSSSSSSTCVTSAMTTTNWTTLRLTTYCSLQCLVLTDTQTQWQQSCLRTVPGIGCHRYC